MSAFIVPLASAAAVAFMAAVAWILGFRARARVTDEAHLRALIAEAEPGAEIAGAVRDQEGRGGLARFTDGRWAAVASMGDRLAVRTFAQAHITQKSGKVRARFADAGFPGLTLSLGAPAPDWLVSARGG